MAQIGSLGAKAALVAPEVFSEDFQKLLRGNLENSEQIFDISLNFLKFSLIFFFEKIENLEELLNFLGDWYLMIT